MSAYDIDFPLSSALQIILEIVGRSFFHWGGGTPRLFKKLFQYIM